MITWTTVGTSFEAWVKDRAWEGVREGTGALALPWWCAGELT